jgi:hypothetical protein
VGALRSVYRYWSWVILGLVVIQVGLAGFGAFYVANKVEDGPIDEDKFEDGFGIHWVVGMLTILLILIAFFIALGGGIRGTRLKRAGGLLGLGILQIVFAELGFAVPVLGFFHPVNALALFVLSGYIAWSEWRAPEVAPATATAAAT